MNQVIITHRDSCKTYALKRIGLIDLIDWNKDEPSIKDLLEDENFEHLIKPEVGCLLIWVKSDERAISGYWIPHFITEDGKILNTKKFDYGHIGVYENDNNVSDVTIDETGIIIRLRKYDDLSKPNYILKYKKK